MADLLAILREADPDRYLATLYAPADKRQALAALYLFNAEIAGIRDRVREALPGEVRIQWWRDALAGGEEAVSGHPVAEALFTVIRNHQLPLEAFDAYLEARVFDLYDDPMPSRGDLEGYCGETASAIIQLAGLILDPSFARSYASAAGHAGCAQAMAGILRMMPVHRSRGQCFIPAEILSAAGTDRDRFVSGEDEAGAQRAVAAMVALGRDHVDRFHEEAKGMPASLRAAFLPAALAPIYLDKISARGFNPLTTVADISALRRHWTLFSSAMRGWG